MLLNNLAVPYMLVSTFSLSLTGLALKKLTEILSLEWLTFLRFILPTLLLFALVAATKIRLPPPALLKPIVIRGMCIAACQLCFIASLNRLTLVESSVLFGTGPLFIAVLEKIFFKVKIKTETKFSLAATFAGVVLLAGDVSGIQLRPELLIGLASGLFSAGSQVCLFRASKKEVTPALLNSWTFLIAAISVLPLCVVSGLSKVDVSIVLEPQHNSLVWAYLLVLSLAVVANQILRSKAYKLADSNSQVAPLIFTSLLFTALWQAMFFDESFSTYQIAGIAIIIVATIMNNFATPLIQCLGVSHIFGRS